MRFFKHILLVVLGSALLAFADTNVNTRTLQESLDSIDNWLGALAASAGGTNNAFLPGTNIVGATYDETNEQWTVDSQTDSFFSSGTLFGSAINLTNKVVPVLSATKTSVQGINPIAPSYFFVTNFTSPSAFTNDYGIWNPGNSAFFRTEKQGVFAVTDTRFHTIYPPTSVGLIAYGPLIRVYEYPTDFSSTNILDYQFDEVFFVGAETGTAASVKKSNTVFHNATSDITDISFQYYVNTTVDITQSLQRVSIHYLGEYE